MQTRIDVGLERDLYDMINHYRISQGWTWRRIVLIGIAEAISKQGDSPDLVLEIVNFLEKRR